MEGDTIHVLIENTQKMKSKNTTAIAEILRDWADLLVASNVNHRSLLIETEKGEFLNF